MCNRIICCVMKELEIKNAIEKRVKSTKSKKYSIWTIGITDDPDRRKAEHKNPTYWMQWRADTDTMARNVEKYFKDKGMKGDVGGGKTPNYVYIF